MKVDGFIDDNEEIKSILGYSVSKVPLSKIDGLVITVGNNRIRKIIAERYNETEMLTLVHPNATISWRAGLGEGSVVMAGVVVNSSAEIGKHVILNTNCSIDHDCVIEDYVHISPNATLAGDVTVGEGTHIGAGATIIQGVKVGKWSILGAGAVLLKDLPDGVVAVGNPARVIRQNKP